MGRVDVIVLAAVALAVPVIFAPVGDRRNLGGFLDLEDPALRLVPELTLPAGQVAVGTFLLETRENLYVAAYVYASGHAAAHALDLDLDSANNVTVPIGAPLPAAPDLPDEVCDRAPCTYNFTASGEEFALANLSLAVERLVTGLGGADAVDAVGRVEARDASTLIMTLARVPGARLPTGGYDRTAENGSAEVLANFTDAVRERCTTPGCAERYVSRSVQASFDYRLFRYLTASAPSNTSIVGPLAWTMSDRAANASAAVRDVRSIVQPVSEFEILYLPMHVLAGATLLWLPSIAFNAVSRRFGFPRVWPVAVYGTVTYALVLVAVGFGRLLGESVLLTVLVPFLVLYALAAAATAWSVPEGLVSDGFGAGAIAGGLAVAFLARGFLDLDGDADMLPALLGGDVFRRATGLLLFAVEATVVAVAFFAARTTWKRVDARRQVRRALGAHRAAVEAAAHQRYSRAEVPDRLKRRALAWKERGHVPSRVAVAFLPRVTAARESLDAPGLALAKRRRLILERRLRRAEHAAAIGWRRGVVRELREWADGRDKSLSPPKPTPAAAPAAAPPVAGFPAQAIVATIPSGIVATRSPDAIAGLDRVVDRPDYHMLIGAYVATDEAAADAPLMRAQFVAR